MGIGFARSTAELQNSVKTNLRELAARLGSGDSFIRSGEVIMLDQFTDPIGSRWSILGTGSVSVSVDTSRSGGSSAKLITAAGAGSATEIARNISYPALSKSALEFSFALGGASSGFDLFGTLLSQIGVEQQYAQFAYRGDSGLLQIQSPLGTWATIGNISRLFPSISLFHTAKLVIDHVSKGYSRLVIGSYAIDLAGYPTILTTTAFELGIQVQIQISSTTAGAKTLYVDDVIVTNNEP